ncbi:hypothetical protein ABZO31_02865 [Streptomyces sp. HUAS MG47]|uniref:hypothetical protein n=1 Tax=Streptomyces solicamelliae TaxID=3231716 RepID=UPI0038780DAD
MLIDEIEESEAALVAPGEELLALPGFWAAYLMWLCRTEEGEQPEPAWFGVDGADADAAYEALSDPERWPVFRVPFGGGHTVVVQACNLPDDPGTQYVVTHPDWDHRGHLATLDGHHAGPGLAWSELLRIARTPDLQAPGLHDPHVRLLLLLPVLGDADLPPAAGGIVRDALVRVGAPEDEAGRLSEALLVDHPLWEPAEWIRPTASPLSGAAPDDRLFDGILLCDEPHSPRSGVSLARGITQAQTRALAHALGTWPPQA